jgi:hypothetical protein
MLRPMLRLKYVAGPDEHRSMYVQLKDDPMGRIAKTIEVTGVTVLVDVSETGELLGLELLSVPRDETEAEMVRKG